MISQWQKKHLIGIYWDIRIMPNWVSDLQEAEWSGEWIEFMQELDRMAKQESLKALSVPPR